MKRYFHSFSLIYNMFKKNIYFARNPTIGVNTHIYAGPNGRITIKGAIKVADSVMLHCAEGAIEIGDSVFINRLCTIVAHECIVIGNGTSIGPNVCIYDHDHDISAIPGPKRFIKAAITIGDNVWIGAGAVILKGVHIGDNSIIGAGTIVTKNIPQNTIVYSEQVMVQRQRS